MQTRWNSQQGFTLIELLVVTVILGVLAALALPAYTAMMQRARYAEVKQSMGVMSREVQLYRTEFGQYPPDVNRDVQPEGIVNWPQDAPFGGKYDYDHWGVGGGQCYVQIGFIGASQQMNYPLFTINAQPEKFEEFDDNLVMGVEVYDCSSGSGPVSP
ncbi:MAG: type II secretion system protein [Cyanobacteria bacterium P01_D01_bin.115]